MRSRLPTGDRQCISTPIFNLRSGRSLNGAAHFGGVINFADVFCSQSSSQSSSQSHVNGLLEISL